MPYSIPYLHSNDQPNCQSCKKIKTLFKAINTATPVDMNTLTGSEMFPIATAQGLRSITLGQYAQAIGGGGGGGGVPSHSIAEHNNVVGNPQNGDVLTYNNGNWQPSAPSNGGATVLNDLTDVNTPFASTGNVLTYVTNEWVAQTPKIFNNTNHAIGIPDYTTILDDGSGNSSFYGTHVALGGAMQNYLYNYLAVGQHVFGYGENALNNFRGLGGFNMGLGAYALSVLNYAMNVTTLTNGVYCKIESPGDTDFTLIGAPNNNQGTFFQATGAGVGTGTVTCYGSENTFLGHYAGQLLFGGNNNIGIGQYALGGSPISERSIGIGTEAGRMTSFGAEVKTLNKSIFIGNDVRTKNFDSTNEIIIGNDTHGLGDNTIRIGNDNSTEALISADLRVGRESIPNNLDPSAALEVLSTSKGFLPPRMTALQAEAIGSPTEGLMVYSTDGTGVTITSKGWWGFDGTNWVKLN